MNVSNIKSTVEDWVRGLRENVLTWGAFNLLDEMDDISIDGHEFEETMNINDSTKGMSSSLSCKSN